MKKISISLGILLYFFSAIGVQASPMETFSPTDVVLGVGIMYRAPDANTYADAVFGHNENNDQYADYTNAAQNGSGNDVYFPDDGTELYVGSNYAFDMIYADVDKAASNSYPAYSGGKAYTLQYYNLSGQWVDLDYTDTTSNFTKTGTNYLSFTAPSVWDSSLYTKASINGKSKYWLRIAAKSLTTVVSAAEVSQIALRAYNVQVNAETERGSDLNETLGEDEFEVSGGTVNSIQGFRSKGDDVYQLALDNNWSDTGYDILITPSNYVGKTVSTGNLNSATAASNITASFEYTHVVQVKNSSGTFVLPDLVIANGQTCEIGAIFAYCALSTSADGTSTLEEVVVSKSGYNTLNSFLSGQRDDRTDAQIVTVLTLTQGGGTDYTPSAYAILSITLNNEDGSAIKGLNENNFMVTNGSDNEIYGFTNNNNGNYILMLSATATDTSYSVKVIADGYVSSTFGTESLEQSTTYKSLALKFAYKLKVVNSSGAGISNATVKAGNNYGTVCNYLGSGEYGCAVPLNDTGTDFKVLASKYKTFYGSFGSDRRYDTDSQVSATATLISDPNNCQHPFDDVYGHWAEGYIESLYCRGIVSGRTSYLFQPDSNITRAEFLKIALLNAGYNPSGYNGENFSDVYEGDWYYSYLSLAEDHDFVNGYADGSFKPNNPINRAEALVILIRIADQTLYGFSSSDIPFSDVKISDWFAYATVIGSRDGILTGYSDGTFKPGNNVSRAEVATMAMRAYNAYYK